MPDGLPVPARGHAFRIFEEPIQTELGAVAHPVSNIAQGQIGGFQKHTNTLEPDIIHELLERHAEMLLRNAVQVTDAVAHLLCDVVTRDMRGDIVFHIILYGHVIML